jgi:hypothetical protein
LKILKYLFLFVFSFALISAIIIPDILKLSHTFFDHDHLVCNEHTKTHFHQVDTECKVVNYKHNHQIEFKPLEFSLVVIQKQIKQKFNYYSFLSEYQSLHFSLRGPPSFS